MSRENAGGTLLQMFAERSGSDSDECMFDQTFLLQKWPISLAMSPGSQRGQRKRLGETLMTSLDQLKCHRWPGNGGRLAPDSSAGLGIDAELRSGTLMFTHRLTIARTVNLCLSFFALGLCFMMPTATISGLRFRTSSSADEIKSIYSARYGGYIVGCVVGGFVFACYNRQFVLFVALLATAVGTVTMPFCRSLISLMACTSVAGVTMGLLETGGNVWLLDLWGRRSAPFMHAMHFCFALGALVAPFVAHPFLSDCYTGSQLQTSLPTLKLLTLEAASRGDVRVISGRPENLTSRFLTQPGNTIENKAAEFTVAVPGLDGGSGAAAFRRVASSIGGLTPAGAGTTGVGGGTRRWSTRETSSLFYVISGRNLTNVTSLRDVNHDRSTAIFPVRRLISAGRVKRTLVRDTSAEIAFPEADIALKGISLSPTTPRWFVTLGEVPRGSVLQFNVPKFLDATVGAYNSNLSGQFRLLQKRRFYSRTHELEPKTVHHSALKLGAFFNARDVRVNAKKFDKESVTSESSLKAISLAQAKRANNLARRSIISGLTTSLSGLSKFKAQGNDDGVASFLASENGIHSAESSRAFAIMLSQEQAKSNVAGRLSSSLQQRMTRTAPKLSENPLPLIFAMSPSSTSRPLSSKMLVVTSTRAPLPKKPHYADSAKHNGKWDRKVLTSTLVNSLNRVNRTQSKSDPLSLSSISTSSANIVTASPINNLMGSSIATVNRSSHSNLSFNSTLAQSKNISSYSGLNKNVSYFENSSKPALKFKESSVENVFRRCQNFSSGCVFEGAASVPRTLFLDHIYNATGVLSSNNISEQGGLEASSLKASSGVLSNVVATAAVSSARSPNKTAFFSPTSSSGRVSKTNFSSDNGLQPIGKSTISSPVHLNWSFSVLRGSSSVIPRVQSQLAMPPLFSHGMISPLKNIVTGGVVSVLDEARTLPAVVHDESTAKSSTLTVPKQVTLLFNDSFSTTFAPYLLPASSHFGYPVLLAGQLSLPNKTTQRPEPSALDVGDLALAKNATDSHSAYGIMDVHLNQKQHHTVKKVLPDDISIENATTARHGDSRISWLATARKRVQESGKFETAYGILAGYVFAVSIIFLFFLCLNPRERRSKQECEFCSDDVIFVSNDSALASLSCCLPRHRRFSLVVLMSSFFFLYVGIEVAVGETLQSLFPSYATPNSQGISTKNVSYGELVRAYRYLGYRYNVTVETGLLSGEQLVYFFWSAFALARGASIFVSMKVSSWTMLTVDVAVSLAASAALVLAARSQQAVLVVVGIVTLALGMASVVPSAFVWLERHTRVTNRLAALLILSSAAGELLIPELVTAFVHKTPIALLYVTLAAVALCAANLAALCCLVPNPTDEHIAKPDRSLYQLANLNDDMEHWQQQLPHHERTSANGVEKSCVIFRGQDSYNLFDSRHVCRSSMERRFKHENQKSCFLYKQIEKYERA